MYFINGVPHEDTCNKFYAFRCSCTSARHVFWLEIWAFGKNEKVTACRENTPLSVDDYKMCSLSVPENHYLGFFKKTWSAIKYIFGAQVEYDEVALTYSSCKEVADLLNSFSADVKNFANTNNIDIPFQIGSFVPSDDEYVESEYHIEEKDCTFVLKREYVYGKDHPLMATMTIRLPKKKFFSRFKYAWNYLRWDGTFADVQISVDMAEQIAQYLYATIPNNLVYD
jgi:hypothetical protein